MVPQENDLVLENLPNVASPSYDRIIPHVVTPWDVVYNPSSMSMVITKGYVLTFCLTFLSVDLLLLFLALYHCSLVDYAKTWFDRNTNFVIFKLKKMKNIFSNLLWTYHIYFFNKTYIFLMKQVPVGHIHNQRLLLMHAPMKCFMEDRFFVVAAFPKSDIK